jgi:hypothetical protein
MTASTKARGNIVPKVPGMVKSTLKIRPDVGWQRSKVRSKLICIKITIKAAKATANPATFKKVATLKRINTLMKLRMIVFITYSILLILKSTQKEYSLNKMADIHSFQDIQRNLVQRNCLNLFRTEKLT